MLKKETEHQKTKGAPNGLLTCPHGNQRAFGSLHLPA